MKFEYNPRILEQLGTELITSDEVAFTELLKNSYDAKANQVKVHFLDSISNLDPTKLLTPVSGNVLGELRKAADGNKIIIIEDDGVGMNRQRLQDGFFTVGSDIKEKLKKAEENAGKMEKMTLGDKGLGRLSSQRLSWVLFVETTDSNDSKNVHFVKIEWSKFSKNLNEDAPEKTIHKLQNGSYTRLWFVGNVNFEKFIDDRRPKQSSLFPDGSASSGIFLQERLQSSVSFLYSPFEETQDDFKVEFYWNENPINSSFHNESIAIAETIHSFRLENTNTKPVLNFELLLRPWYVELIHLRLLGKNLFTERKCTPEHYASILDKYKERLNSNLTKKYSLDRYMQNKDEFHSEIKLPLEQMMPIEGKVYAFHRESFRLGLAITSAKSMGLLKPNENMNSIRSFLNYHNGIKLYRDKFRIANLGDKESDWLNLQQARTRGQQFFRFELGNVMGYVKINDFYQNHIKETSSRQELRQSPNASALKQFLQTIFNDDFYQLSTSAYYLVRDILEEEGLVPKNTPKELKEQVNESEKLLKETLGSLNMFQNSFREIKDNITLDSPDKIKTVQKIIQNLDGEGVTLSESITNSITTLQSAKETLTVIEDRQRESYNNYKLMANGLITEVMTHELHSILLNTKSGTDYNQHIEKLKTYLLDAKQIGLFKNELKPIGERMDFLHKRITDLDLFYNFLEKTFIKQGTRDDFEYEKIDILLNEFQKRMEQRLKELKTSIVHDLTDYSWYVPKGTLTHVLYNLIDNSLYWIGERQKRSAYDQLYKSEERDYIRIVKIDASTIHYCDSGTGVIEDLQFSLFHPFKSGKKDGRGMGLYIVKNLLESFGGAIQLLPELNKYGNRYIFSLSTTQDEQA